MVGALGPALKAGSPVTGSVTIFIRCGRFRRGVSTIRPSSIFASSGSPGRISSRRRSGPGRTTCPLVDTLVCMVRRSYLNETFFAIKLGLPGPYSLLPFPYLAFFRCACGTFGSVLVCFLSIIPQTCHFSSVLLSTRPAPLSPAALLLLRQFFLGEQFKISAPCLFPDGHSPRLASRVQSIQP